MRARTAYAIRTLVRARALYSTSYVSNSLSFINCVHWSTRSLAIFRDRQVKDSLRQEQQQVTGRYIDIETHDSEYTVFVTETQFFVLLLVHQRAARAPKA